MTSSSNSRDVSYVKVGGPVDLTRCSPGYKNNCLLFIFEKPGTIYEDARDMLQSHFCRLGQNEYDHTSFSLPRTSEAKRYIFDAMRQKSINSVSQAGAPLIIEAHLRHQFESLTKKRHKYETKKSALDIIRDLAGTGSMTLRKDKYTHYMDPVKVRTAIPDSPIFKVYTVKNMPLGSPQEVRSDVIDAVWTSILEGHRQLSTTVMKSNQEVVDAVEGYTTDGRGENPLYNGSFHIIINKSLLPPSLPIPSSFYLYGKQYFFGRETSHYMYCTNCKALDSHVLREAYCGLSLRFYPSI